MKAWLPISALVLLTACGSAQPAPAPTPSVLVSTVGPKQGSLTRTITAYGSVAPATNGTQTLSEAQPGQVTRLLVTAGAAVRAGQRLATFVTAPTARSSYNQAADALKAAQKQRATIAQLLSQQLATQDQLSQAEKAVADAQTALAALRAEGAGSASHTLTAPFDGVVTAIAVAQGDRTQPGAPILTVARAGGIVVTAGVDPGDRGRVTVGQAASLTRLSGGATLAGRVLRVDSALDPRTRLIDVDVAFPDSMLLPGEGMRVAIATGRVPGWIVPHTAVVTTGGPVRVFQVARGKAKAVLVTLALASDNGDVLTGAIDPRLPLIVAGAYQVTDGDAVRTSN